MSAAEAEPGAAVDPARSVGSRGFIAHVHRSYSIFSEVTEDRLGEADNLDEAVQVARALAREGPPDDPISIEFGGRVVRQLVRTPAGAVEEVPAG